MGKKKPTGPAALKLKGTTSGLECLGDFVRRIRQQKRLSVMDVSKQSALFGPPIAGSYITRIERDPKLRVTADRLKALAHGLGIPIPELLAHAVGEMTHEEADELALVTRFRELSPQRKADVRAILQALHSQELCPEDNAINTAKD